MLRLMMVSSMAELKFNCPSCSQKIECGEEWGGQQIQCPACHENIQVPATEARTAAAPESKPGLKIGLAAHQKSAPAPVASFSHGANPVRHFSASQGGAEAIDKASKIKRIVTIAACVLLIPPAGYYGFTAIRNYQAKLNVGRQKAGEDSDGGRMGHIAELYDVLDKTDPSRNPTIPMPYETGPGSKGSASRGTNAESGGVEEKPVPPKWTLDVDKVKLQRGKVNGKIAGTNFIAGAVLVDVNGPTHLLSIREGTNFVSDRELLVYLKLRPGESLKGLNWTIGPDTRTNVPTVVKKWRPNPRFAPQQKSFANGYAMKLEFVNESPDLAQGRIYLALPDSEQTVVAGQFSASIRQARPVAAATTTAPIRRPPTQQPIQQQQRRY